jgi:hypothetical protein
MAERMRQLVCRVRENVRAKAEEMLTQHGIFISSTKRQEEETRQWVQFAVVDGR